MELSQQHEKKSPMRWIWLVAITLFGIAILIFAVQNLETVTMAFLGFKIRAPLAVLAIIVYVLGAVTGSSLLALLRQSYRRSTASSVDSDH